MAKKSSTPEVENNTAPAVDDKILDLDELTEPVGQFKINGIVYEFHQMGLLSLFEQQTIDSLWKKIQEIRKKPKPTKTEEETYTRALKRLLPLISTMPIEEVEDTQLPKLLNAVVCFFSFRTASSVALVMRMAAIAGKDPQSIGVTSFPVSTDSGQKPTP